MRCDAGYERNLVELESERLYQNACLQLCNLCKLQSAEPFLELDKIDLVAVLTQIIADAHDVCEVQTVGKDGLCGLYDDVQEVQSLYRRVLAERFRLAYLLQSAVQQKILHSREASVGQILQSAHDRYVGAVGKILAQAVRLSQLSQYVPFVFGHGLYFFAHSKHRILQNTEKVTLYYIHIRMVRC